MKLRFIFNPRSGHNARNPHLLARAREFIREHRLDATVVPTERPLHATDLARQAIAEGCDVVVAIGGDGTMNEIATALVDSPSTLGLIPCGSGNGLGRHLGIPGPGHGAFANLLKGQVRLIDSGFANERAFFNVMGLGFDAEISERFTKVSRRGFGAYIGTTLAAWRNYQAPEVHIHGGGQDLLVRAFILSVANSDQFGNNCYIAPGARVDDGILDLTVLKPVNLLQAIPLGYRLFTQRVGGSPHALRLRGEKFVIDRQAPGLIHTDGEPFVTGARVTISVRPRSLRVLVPDNQRTTQS
ncbi:MAG: diacylglycerol kinase family lipid kinase [Cephaloticoccus sp.]|nr:diacylglycerol kinase family lipid kinase [Cephaloticoccus sp.]MCF7759308.1 diacylglycerol kinase family lipid kinase [Cephaloticoccus sp.]